MLDQFASISEQLSAITGKLDGILVNAESMSADAAGMLDSTGPEVADLVTDIRLTVRNLNDLILMLGEEPESLLFGRSRGRRTGDDR
jgi:hypothetical protein